MYINIHRIKRKVHCGEVNIPYGMEFDVDEQRFLYCVQNGVKKRICWETSEFAYQNFAWNDDGNGVERIKLITECIDIMARIDKNTEFDKLFNDFVAMRYKDNPNDMETWSWDRYKVHHAPIEDLKYLRNVFKGMKKIELR